MKITGAIGPFVVETALGAFVYTVAWLFAGPIAAALTLFLFWYLR